MHDSEKPSPPNQTLPPAISRSAADAARVEKPLPSQLKFKDLLSALLKQPVGLAEHKASDEKVTFIRLGILALVAMLIFGVVLGTFTYGEQLWAVPLKLGGGLIFAGLICYPSLYIFSQLSGSEASAGRVACLMSGMLALAGLLLIGFAPAVWIFAQGISSIGFMGFLVIVTWVAALGFAFKFIRTTLRKTGAENDLPLVVWFVIFFLVSLQLSTSLRPILGKSDKLMTTEKKFFLQHWGETLNEPNEPKKASDTVNSRNER